MSKEVYTGILGEIQEEYNKQYPNCFNPENMGDCFGHNLPDYKYIDFTGDDGYGENCHLIFMWKGKYYKMTGFSHKSHYGTDWYGSSDSVREVTPKTVERVVYE